MAKPKILKTKRIYEGKVISLRLDTLKTESGIIEREVVEHSGAVVIAAFDNKGRVLLVRQYRHAAGRELLELPAGGLNPGEKPEVTAQRELQEETGYAASKLKRLFGFFTVPGFCEEYMHLFEAHGLKDDRLPHDDDEEIVVEPTPLSKIPGLIKSGKIEDAKSIAGLLTVIYLQKSKR